MKTFFNFKKSYSTCAVTASLVLIFTFSCKAKSQSNDPAQNSNKLNMSENLNNYSGAILKNGSKEAAYFNNISRFLAGMSIPSDSRFYAKSRNKYYKRHIHSLNTFWHRVEKNTLSKVTPWQKENVPSMYKKNIAFYPLSGADFINLHLMYPDAADYLMVALEEPGFAPEISSLNNKRLSRGLRFIQNSLRLYGINNYFATAVMREGMTKNRNIKGITPILMIFMTRMGHQIIDVKPVGINKSGTLDILDKKGKISGKWAANKGILIHFKDAQSQKIKRLVYIKAYLNRKNLSNSTATGRYFNGIGRTKTMMKSAIYLCHKKSYVPVTRWIVQKSDMIIQDDSAIPYKYFSKNWTTQLYGNYIPMKVKRCPYSYQRDLAKEYKKRSRPLPFFFGYGILWGKNKSNLLIGYQKEKKL